LTLVLTSRPYTRTEFVFENELFLYHIFFHFILVLFSIFHLP
jgi:hypothetical protein